MSAETETGPLLEALLQALEDATPESPEGAISTEELCRKAGLSRARALRLVRDLIAEGRAEHVRIPHTFIDGRRSFIPGWRLIR